jgi:hypothetical protein
MRRLPAQAGTARTAPVITLPAARGAALTRVLPAASREPDPSLVVVGRPSPRSALTSRLAG